MEYFFLRMKTGDPIFRTHHDSSVNFRQNSKNAVGNKCGIFSYAWKLDGFFEKWTEPGTANLIRYTNLPPGKYTLYVRAMIYRLV